MLLHPLLLLLLLCAPSLNRCWQLPGPPRWLQARHRHRQAEAPRAKLHPRGRQVHHLDRHGGAEGQTGATSRGKCDLMLGGAPGPPFTPRPHPRRLLLLLL